MHELVNYLYTVKIMQWIIRIKIATSYNKVFAQGCTRASLWSGCAPHPFTGSAAPPRSNALGPAQGHRKYGTLSDSSISGQNYRSEKKQKERKKLRTNTYVTFKIKNNIITWRGIWEEK